MAWVSRLLRGERVWARAVASGALDAGGDGRVDVVYKPGGKLYRASARNLDDDPRPELLAEIAIAGAPGANAGSPRARGPAPAHASSPAVDPIIVYVDGACSGNPGPCGLGVVILDGRERRERSEYLGVGTNNVAELTAILRALEELPRGRTVLVHSDSAYALGLLGRGWKAKANQELVERLRVLASEFADLRLIKVAGHAGIPENERADALARQAVARRG